MVVSESRANLVAAFLALADQAGAELLLLDEGFVTREYAELRGQIRGGTASP